MKQFLRSIAVLLVSAGLAQSAGAQFNVSGPGFLPDENGTNLDAPVQKQNSAAGKFIQDCAECPEMVVIPAGTFVMGSYKRANEQPTHSVNLRSFLMGKTEVTQGQWYEVMGTDPSAKKGRTLPVEQVTWYTVQQFITKLNQKTGHKYRLPSEAEWEYAARAGSTTEWSFGNDELKLGNYGWHAGNSTYKTHEVGQKLPNAFGLFDMYGNVAEWTLDCWHETYAGAPTDGSAWTTGCSGNDKVLRGGSWNGYPAFLRSAIRLANSPDNHNYFISGFRLARDL